jgi:alcohol dehydrogenase class IV
MSMDFAIRQFFMTTRIVMGVDCIRTLAEETVKFGARRVLIVTDQGIVGAGLLDPVLAEVKKSGAAVQVFDRVKPNPTIEDTNAACAELAAHAFDLIVAVGGGSVIDCAKAISILLTNGGSIADYFGREKFAQAPVPLFAVPTTVGTGSEVTRACVITDTVQKMKKIVGGAGLAPRIAFLDARLVSRLPAPLVAATGMDALTHAIEGYVSKNATPITDALNLHAIRMIGAHIRPAVASSDNLEAMQAMLTASTTTGIGFGNALLGIVHSISHAFGGLYNAPHGILNAILLPYVCEYNWIGNPRKFADIAEAFRLDVRGLTVEEAAKAAVDHIKSLVREVGIPAKMSEIGIADADLEWLTDTAYNDIYVTTNPRRPSREDIRSIIKSAL